MARNRGETETAEVAENTEGNGRKAPVKGIVNSTMEVTGDSFPKFARKTGYTRESEIEQTLKNVRNEFPEGTVVKIREYEKRESANGTLYNLRKRHGKPGTEGWDGWTIHVGPVEGTDLTGLYVAFTDPANYVAETEEVSA